MSATITAITTVDDERQHAQYLADEAAERYRRAFGEADAALGALDALGVEFERLPRIKQVRRLDRATAALAALRDNIIDAALTELADHPEAERT